MDERHRAVELPGGVTLQVEVTGAGPPVVLLHGFTGDASTMAVLATRLAADHTVIVPNLIGHGGSTGPAGDHQVDAYGVEAMAEQVLALLEVLGHAAPHDVVGYSMGGRVALTMACRFPAHVASLSLIGASAGLATEQERAERREADEALATSILADGLDAFVDRWMANPLFATQARLGAEFLAAARAQRMHNSPEELARSLRGAGTGAMAPLHGELDRCTMPVNLVVGAEDGKFRAIAEELAAVLPDAVVSEIAAAGHAAHLEQPDAVVETILATARRAAVQLHLVSLPMVAAHTTGRGTTVRRDSLLVALRAEGHTGWGEASPMPGWSVDRIDEANAALATPGIVLDGEPAWTSTAAWRDALADVGAARAAVAGAACDLDARRAGLPLARHLARWHPRLDESAVTAGVEVNALVSAPDPAAVADEVRAHLDAGIATVKLKVGALDPSVDIERVAAARAAGPGIALRLDANGAWDHATALAVLHAVGPYDIALCEEPVRGIDEIAALALDVDIPLAVDESARSAADHDAVMSHAGAIRALIIKPQALGGPDLAIDAIVAARNAGLEVILTSMIDSAVGLAHAAHVAAACGLGGAHGLATAGLLGADVAPGLPVRDGRITIPEAPGLGIGLVSPGLVAAS